MCRDRSSRSSPTRSRTQSNSSSSRFKRLIGTDIRVGLPPDTLGATMHSVGMPSSIPAPLAPVIAGLLTSFKPSLRLVGLSGLPAYRELEAFLSALASVPADAPTACSEWTAHDLVAHMAAGSDEMTRLINARLALGPHADIGPTRAFEERETLFRAMADPLLRRRFVVNGLALTDAVLRLQAAGPAVTVPFTGWAMTASELILHGQSELTLHRWDLVGSDATSMALLGNPELLEHGHKVVDRMGNLEIPTHVGDPSDSGSRALLALWGRDPDCNMKSHRGD